MSDGEVERLLAGQAPQGDADLEELARFFRDLDTAIPGTRMVACETAHVAAMLETSRLLAENGEPAARPASNAHGPESQASGLPKWRNVMGWKLLKSRWAKVTAVAAALVMALSGVAYAGALPAPVQHAVAGAAQTVGIALPDPGDVNDGDVDNVDEGAVGDTNDEQSGNVDEGDVGNVDEGDVGDTNDEQSGNVEQGGADQVDQGQAGDSGSGGATAPRSGTSGSGGHRGSSGGSNGGGSSDSQNGDGQN